MDEPSNKKRKTSIIWDYYNKEYDENDMFVKYAKIKI